MQPCFIHITTTFCLTLPDFDGYDDDRADLVYGSRSEEGKEELVTKEDHAEIEPVNAQIAPGYGSSSPKIINQPSSPAMPCQDSASPTVISCSFPGRPETINAFIETSLSNTEMVSLMTDARIDPILRTQKSALKIRWDRTRSSRVTSGPTQKTDPIGRTRAPDCGRRRDVGSMNRDSLLAWTVDNQEARLNCSPLTFD
jgi:hypothetical protein